VTPCVALAPPANPPAPKLPTLPAPFGPQVTLRTLRTTGALTSRNVPLRVGCDTGCALSVTATVTPAARPKRHRRAVTVTLKPIRQQFAAGDTHVVRLTITRAQVKRLRRALHGRRSLLANLEVTATPAAGQPTLVAKELKLRA
jgi:hypothetical protein